MNAITVHFRPESQLARSELLVIQRVHNPLDVLVLDIEYNLHGPILAGEVGPIILDAIRGRG